jgi:hypothetical protein
VKPNIPLFTVVGTKDTQQLEGGTMRDGCNKRRSSTRGGVCLLMEGSAATGGSGLMRGGDTGGWEAMQQPAKQERLYKRQSCQAGGYTAIIQVIGARQEADAQK